MNPEQWQRLKLLFDEALDKTPEEQSALLARLRSQDEELAVELERLLEAHQMETLPIDAAVLKNPDLYFGNPPLLQEDEVLSSRFRIVRFLGRGGMGEVYEAKDVHMGRIAIKIIRPDIACNSSVLARFKHEAVAARSITNSFVCRIHEFLTAPPENGRPEIAFLTMEFLEGCTLAERIRLNGALSWREAKSLALQLCDGLQAIHERGVIHRDLKPRNIMLVPRQSGVCPVIMDFGLARQTAAAAMVGCSFTQPGALVGTPEYMAPEQFEGRDLSPATDIYALGVILYEMAAGKHPFEASTPLGAAMRRAKRPPSIRSSRPELPRHWDQVIQRCLEYDAGARYQSARELADAFRQSPLHIVKLPRTVLQVSVQHWIVFSGALIVLLVAIGGAILFYVHQVAPPPNAAALHWYNKGVTALREGTYLTATHAFQQAIRFDKNYAIAHARLADAWSDLDFIHNAEHEMIIASASESSDGLSKVDRDYLAAIRSMVTGDFVGAAREYERILRELPPGEKGAGYLELGRAQERAGNIDEAMKSYSAATHLPPESPGPFLRLAVLESRSGNANAAEQAFSTAEELYRAEVNYEGIAEVNYQRGYAASAAYELKEAREFILKSLQAAGEMGSVQLEIRALTALGTIAYGGGDDPKCIELANKAINLALDNGLEYWAINARIRLANAYTDSLDFAKAEVNLQNALHAAIKAEHPRLEALANWGLASLRDEEKKPDETITYARRAFGYYKKNAFFNESLNVLILLARAEEQKGSFKESLRSSREALDIAKRSKNLALISLAEEAVGNAQLRLEEYPAALEHFQAALATSQQAGQQVEFQMMHNADVLWRLGRYGKAEMMLNQIPGAALKQADLAYEVNRVWAEMRASQRRSQEALFFARRAEQLAKSLPPSDLATIHGLIALTTVQLGGRQAAQQLCHQAWVEAQQQSDPATLASLNMSQAIVSSISGSANQAEQPAEAAHEFFQKSGQRESEWECLLWLAKIEAGKRDPRSSQKFASEALDIVSGLEHNWGSPAFTSYLSRPDIRKARGELHLLARR